MSRFGIAVILIALISTAYHILLSHRIFGPLINFNRSLDALLEGDLRRKVTLRKRDYFREEATKTNTIISSLDTTFSKLNANQDKFQAVIAELPESDLKNRLTALSENNESILGQWN